MTIISCFVNKAQLTYYVHLSRRPVACFHEERTSVCPPGQSPHQSFHAKHLSNQQTTFNQLAALTTSANPECLAWCSLTPDATHKAFPKRQKHSSSVSSHLKVQPQIFPAPLAATILILPPLLASSGVFNPRNGSPYSKATITHCCTCQGKCLTHIRSLIRSGIQYSTNIPIINPSPL